MSLRLLVLSCSSSKRTEKGDLSAIERYDGPSFRVLRKFVREHSADALPLIYVLSAEFGLIPASQPIPYYDHRMTFHRAEQMNAGILEQFEQTVKSRRLDKLFLSMSRHYELALKGYEDRLPPNIEVVLSRGTPGRRLSELHDWLYQEPPPTPAQPKSGTARIRGVELKLSDTQILDIARRELTISNEGSGRYQSWCVMIDGQPVSAKWLVSKLTGLRVSDFGGSEARRVLEQLGLKVVRT